MVLSDTTRSEEGQVTSPPTHQKNSTNPSFQATLHNNNPLDNSCQNHLIIFQKEKILNTSNKTQHQTFVYFWKISFIRVFINGYKIDII